MYDCAFMQSVIVDLDGVLADFTRGYRTLANKLFNKEQFDTLARPHDSWNDPDISPEEDAAIWAEIEKPEANFWMRLDSLLDPNEWYRLSEMARRTHNVYFVTNRRAADAKHQSEYWLNNYAINNPTVILAKDKGAFAKHLNASWAIDDMWQNVWDMSHHCWSYAMSRPHNAAYNWPYRVSKFSEWLDLVEKGEAPGV
jgi:phosphoglycolate phosphatase-like HAD superfamily hydrolase